MLPPRRSDICSFVVVVGVDVSAGLMLMCCGVLCANRREDLV